MGAEEAGCALGTTSAVGTFATWPEQPRLSADNPSDDLFPAGGAAFLLVRLDIPPVAQLLRGMFNGYFLTLAIAGVIGTIAVAVAGRLVFSHLALA